MNLAYYCYPYILPWTWLIGGERNGKMLDKGRCSPHDPTLRVSLSFVGEGGSKAHERTAER